MSAANSSQFPPSFCEWITRDWRPPPGNPGSTTTLKCIIAFNLPLPIPIWRTCVRGSWKVWYFVFDFPESQDLTQAWHELSIHQRIQDSRGQKNIDFRGGGRQQLTLDFCQISPLTKNNEWNWEGATSSEPRLWYSRQLSILLESTHKICKSKNLLFLTLQRKPFLHKNV